MSGCFRRGYLCDDVDFLGEPLDEHELDPAEWVAELAAGGDDDDTDELLALLAMAGDACVGEGPDKDAKEADGEDLFGAGFLPDNDGIAVVPPLESSSLPPESIEVSRESSELGHVAIVASTASWHAPSGEPSLGACEWARRDTLRRSQCGAR